MASGDTLCIFTPQGATFPTSNAPTFDTRGTHLVLDFDDSQDETCYFAGVMPQHYAGTTGVTVTVVWAATSSTTNGCQWEVAFERLQDENSNSDLDTPGFAAVNAGNGTAPTGGAGQLQYTAITFTDGADMDSVVAGEAFRMSINRDTGYGSDMTGDAELVRIEIQET